MKWSVRIAVLLVGGMMLGLTQAQAQAQATSVSSDAAIPQKNTSVVDSDGTAHITRVIPVPSTISPAAQTSLRNNHPDQPQTLAERRAGTDHWQNGAGEKSRSHYPVNIKEAVIAGVPVRDVTPMTLKHADSVLICLHGGGFNSDSGSLTEKHPDREPDRNPRRFGPLPTRPRTPLSRGS